MKSRIQLFICLLSILIIQTNSLLGQVAKGEIIEIKNFQSKYVDSRTISIWFPEGYDSLKSYPVLYMHDGQMLFDSTITWNKQEWKVDETASNLISKNKIKPFIVVGLWYNGNQRRFEYMPQKPFSQLPKETEISVRKQLMDTK